MREGIIIEVNAADRERLVAVVADRNSPQKHVWGAGIILATAEGRGTAEIMRHAGVSGTRPHPARPADEEGAGRHDDPRLYSPRHDHHVRGSQRPRRHGNWPVHGTPSAPGVHPLS